MISLSTVGYAGGQQNFSLFLVRIRHQIGDVIPHVRAPQRDRSSVRRRYVALHPENEQDTESTEDQTATEFSV